MSKNIDRVYDEGQKIERGKAFMYGFFTMTGLVFLCWIFRGTGIKIFSDDIQLYICLMPSFSVCMIYMIRKDAYDGVYEETGRLIFTCFAIMGTLQIASALLLIIRKSIPLISNGVLSDEIGKCIWGINFILVCAYYWFHKYNQKKTLESEDV